MWSQAVKTRPGRSSPPLQFIFEIENLFPGETPNPESRRRHLRAQRLLTRFVGVRTQLSHWSLSKKVCPQLWTRSLTRISGLRHSSKCHWGHWYFRVQVSGFRFQGSGFRVQSPEVPTAPRTPPPEASINQSTYMYRSNYLSIYLSIHTCIFKYNIYIYMYRYFIYIYMCIYIYIYIYI